MKSSLSSLASIVLATAAVAAAAQPAVQPNDANAAGSAAGMQSQEMNPAAVQGQMPRSMMDRIGAAKAWTDAKMMCRSETDTQVQRDCMKRARSGYDMSMRSMEGQAGRTDDQVN